LKRHVPDFDAARTRHVLFSMAAFLAFVTFYSFAGAPTLRLISPAPHLFLIVVVLTASLYLARRIERTQRAFAEETLAKNIVKRWEWPEPVPRNLREAFLVHTIRSKESQKNTERSLDIYQEAVREALADGIVTRHEVQLLESLRNQLQIKKAEHDRIMSALAEEERSLLSSSQKHLPAEKRLQLENYTLALGNYLERAFKPGGGKTDDAILARLWEEYRITPEEHAAVLEDLLGGSRHIGARLMEAVCTIERSAHTIAALQKEPSPAHDLLKDILELRRSRSVQVLVKGLTLHEDLRRHLAEGLNSSEPARRERVIEQLRNSVLPVLADRMLASQRQTCAHESSLKTLKEKLIERTRSADPYERAVAIYLTGHTEPPPQNLKHVAGNEHAVVQDTMVLVKAKGNSGIASRNSMILLSTVEKMIALRSAPLFSRLEPESLERLARSCHEGHYIPGQPLCVEGERGDEVFILVAGDVEVVKGEGDHRKLLAREKAGSFIGELAVIDSAPRSATVLAGPNGVHVLCLHGAAFRHALDHDASIATEVMRTLAQRLKQKNAEAAAAP
jgi:hypothetical protein